MKNLYQNISKVILFAILSVYATSAQNTITIDNTPQSSTQYTTIQAAHDAAVDGDIIYVQPSPTSYGAVTITKPITIIGRSHSEPNNISILSTVNIRSSNVTLKGLFMGGINATSNISGSPISVVKVYECEFSGVTFGAFAAESTVDGFEIRGCVFGSLSQYPDSDNILISNNIIYGSGMSIYSPSTIIISNNIFRYSSNWSFGNQAPGETVILYNNMFITNSSNRTISFSGSGDFNISNCLTYNYGAGDITFTQSGAATFQVNNSYENTDPLFTNVDPLITNSMAGTSTYNSAKRSEDDLTLQATSLAIIDDTVTPRLEYGVFNNGFNFKYLGNPRGLPVLDIVTYDGAIPKNGNINVTIKAKAN